MEFPATRCPPLGWASGAGYRPRGRASCDTRQRYGEIGRMSGTEGGGRGRGKFFDDLAGDGGRRLLGGGRHPGRRWRASSGPADGRDHGATAGPRQTGGYWTRSMESRRGRARAGQEAAGTAPGRRAGSPAGRAGKPPAPPNPHARAEPAARSAEPHRTTQNSQAWNARGLLRLTPPALQARFRTCVIYLWWLPGPIHPIISLGCSVTAG